MSPYHVIYPDSDAEITAIGEDKTTEEAELLDDVSQKYLALFNLDDLVDQVDLINKYTYIDKIFLDYTIKMSAWGATLRSRAVVTVIITLQADANHNDFATAGAEVRRVTISDCKTLNEWIRARLEIGLIGTEADCDARDELFQSRRYGQGYNVGLLIQSIGVNKFGAGKIKTLKANLHQRPRLIIKTVKGWFNDRH